MGYCKKIWRRMGKKGPSEMVNKQAVVGGEERGRTQWLSMSPGSWIRGLHLATPPPQSSDPSSKEHLLPTFITKEMLNFN